MNTGHFDKVVLRTFAVLLIAGGFTHWLIIFGVLYEKTPYLLGLYFHSLAFFSLLAGIGVWCLREWGIKLALLICLTQIPSHLYMLYLDIFKDWQSGYSVPWRLLDLGLVAAGLTYISIRRSKRAT